MTRDEIDRAVREVELGIIDSKDFLVLKLIPRLLAIVDTTEPGCICYRLLEGHTEQCEKRMAAWEALDQLEWT